MSFPSGESLIIHPQQSVDRFGDETDGDPVPVDGCAVWPAGSTEQEGLQDTVTGRLEAFLPHGTVVRSVDEIEWRGDRYEIQGEPFDFTSPLTGSQPGVLVTMQRVTG